MPGMRLLVLGGTHHVGRAVVETALARGDDVTTLTRGTSGPSAAGALALHADRTAPTGRPRPVYRWPIPPGLDESGPVVDGDPADTGSADYAAAKRGGELAAVEAFGDRALLARAGLILGPYEIVGSKCAVCVTERSGDVDGLSSLGLLPSSR
jgi:uncharacterized protein YbjT (DUF2867 family)